MTVIKNMRVGRELKDDKLEVRTYRGEKGLNDAVKAKARKANMSVSQWIRVVLRNALGK